MSSIGMGFSPPPESDTLSVESGPYGLGFIGPPSDEYNPQQLWSSDDYENARLGGVDVQLAADSGPEYQGATRWRDARGRRSICDDPNAEIIPTYYSPYASLQNAEDFCCVPNSYDYPYSWTCQSRSGPDSEKRFTIHV